MAAAPRTIRTALVLGGGSEIGLAILDRCVERGLRAVVLAVREPDRVRGEPAVAALADRGVDVHLERWDALDAEGHEPCVGAAVDRLGEVDLVICAVGSLGHHAGLSVDPVEADRSLRTNVVGPAAALLVAARALVAQGRGEIVVLSSIAAGRARRSNFVYGAGKAGLDTFAQGLGDAVEGSGVHVHVLRPGFVQTKMTEGLDPAPFATTADVVAAAAVGALDAGRSRVVWVPPLLGPMMGVLRNVPRPVWRKVAGDR